MSPLITRDTIGAMFFVVSKMIGVLLNPFHLLLLLCGLTALFGWLKGRKPSRFTRVFRRLTQAGVAVSLIWALMLAVPVLPYHAVKTLEDRFPAPDLTALDPAVIVVLGGWQGSGYQFVGRAQPPISGAGDRLITGLMLAERFPRARVYLPGGLRAAPDLPSEADVSRAVIAGLGLEASRFVVEDKSKTTAENARFIEAMIGPSADQQILLVTSAWHMPRSMGAFRAAGLEPVALPTDHLTSTRRLPLKALTGKGMTLMAVALHEWVGLLGYWATGRVDTLFPRP